MPIKVCKLYYLQNELDNNFQNINLDNTTSILPQISISSGMSPVYHENSKNFGNIYYTFTNYGNKVVANGVLELKNLGKIFYSFIENIIIINGIPVIPTGTISRIQISSGTDYFFRKKGHLIISYLENKHKIKVIIY